MQLVMRKAQLPAIMRSQLVQLPHNIGRSGSPPEEGSLTTVKEFAEIDVWCQSSKHHQTCIVAVQRRN